MRHILLATGLAFTVSMAFAMVPAKAEMGGPVVNTQGQCLILGAGNQNGSLGYYGECKKPAKAAAAAPRKSKHKG